MSKQNRLYIIPLMVIFLLGLSGCSTNSRATITPACTSGECLVKVVNNCPYPIYLLDPNLPDGQQLLSKSPIQPMGSAEFYDVSTSPELLKKAIGVAAGSPMVNGQIKSGLPCSKATQNGMCQLGWGNQGTLFEFTFNPSDSPGNIYYDISAVNGFDFPMTVQVTGPVGGNNPGQCTEIDTANLDVSNCSEYVNLSGTTSCSSPAGNPGPYCVRQAVYPSDFANIYTGGLDCHLPVVASPTACRAPRTFGVNYFFLFPNSNSSPTCPFSTIDYTITPQSLLTHWTCANPEQPNDSSSLCWGLPATLPGDSQTSYYSWIKAAVGYGTSTTSIYAFPQDDGYSTYEYTGHIVDECTALTPRFTLTIGPSAATPAFGLSSDGATGECPPCPGC